MFFLNICNKTNKDIDEKWLRLVFEKIYRKLESEKQTKNKIEELSGLSLVFIEDDEMRQINNKYRGINKTTDVLSFELGDDNKFIICEPESQASGEILISPKEALREAKLQKITFKKEIVILFIHGILHILGYDHEEDEERKKMREEENKIIKEII